MSISGAYEVASEDPDEGMFATESRELREVNGDSDATRLDTRRAPTMDRWRELIEMRKNGIDYDTIADKLGYASGEAASSALRRALRRFAIDEAEDYRLMEASKLDDVEGILWPRVKAADPEAIKLWLRVHKARCDLFGLGLQRQEITHKGRANNQTMIVVGGDGKSYAQSLVEFERRMEATRNPSLPAPSNEQIDLTADSNGMFAYRVEEDGKDGDQR